MNLLLPFLACLWGGAGDYSAYHGRLSPLDAVEGADEAGYATFSILDEAGENHTWSTRWNRVYVVPIWGSWVGPSSPNHRRPADLLDLYAFLHDAAYETKGYFSAEEDGKLVHRILENWDRLGALEKVPAALTVGWFTTMGRLISCFNCIK